MEWLRTANCSSLCVISGPSIKVPAERDSVAFSVTLDDVAPLDHKPYIRRVRQQGQIGQGITRYPDEVIPRARRQHAHPAHADGARGDGGCGPDAVDRLHPQLVHEKELLAVGARRLNPGVGAKCDVTAGLYPQP